MSELKRIIYRGVSLIEGRPDRIKAAQEHATYRIAGEDFGRVRYGDEQSDGHAERQACHDGRVIKGEFHVVGCDVEECPKCGEQVLSCDCPYDEEA